MSDTTYRTLTPIFEQLVGERVIVRPFTESDAQALYDAIDESREHIGRWMPWPAFHKQVEDSLDWIIKGRAAWLLRENFPAGMWDKESGRFLGGIGLHIHNWDIRSFEIGYWLRASAEGHGYMSESVRLLTRFAFDTWEANRVLIRCDVRNKRSAAVPRRLGFVQEACFRHDNRATDGTLRDTLVFALIREDYAKVTW